jgi:hypothetical protein
MAKFNLFEDLTPWLVLDRPGIKGNPHFSQDFSAKTPAKTPQPKLQPWARTGSSQQGSSGPNHRQSDGAGRA